MIHYCYANGCKNKNICIVYSTLVRYQNDVVADISSCKYLTNSQGDVPIVNNAANNPIALTERIRKLKKMKRPVSVTDAPQVIDSAKRTGMKFNIDDKDIS